MSPSERLCVLLFDEMTIKEAVHFSESEDRVLGFEDFGTEKNYTVANHASVFMVRGLQRKWKQPFGFFFSTGTMKADRLSNLIADAIRKLQRRGLNCIAFVSDQGSNNQSALRQLGVSMSHPYFEVDGAVVRAPVNR